MKQKLFLLLMLVVAFVACTKEDAADDYQKSASIYEMILGKFEGEWIVDEQVIGTDTLSVFDRSFNIRLPEKYFVEEAFNTYFAHDFRYEFTPSEEHYEFTCTQKAYSDNKRFFDFDMSQAVFSMQLFQTEESLSSLKNQGIAEHFNEHEAWVDVTTFQNKQGIAVYDETSRLWTLRIPDETGSLIIREKNGSIDKRTYSRHNKIDVNNSPTILFVTQKKLR